MLLSDLNVMTDVCSVLYGRSHCLYLPTYIQGGEGRSQNRERPKKYITEDRKHNYPSIKVVLTEKLFLDKKHHNESALEQKLLWGKINILYARC